MQANRTISKTVSSSEAKSRFGELLKWTTQNRDRVVVKLYGEPAAVIMSYREYEEIEQLRKREQKRRGLEALETLRNEAGKQNPNRSPKEAYRQAGFSEKVVEETLSADKNFPKLRP